MAYDRNEVVYFTVDSVKLQYMWIMMTWLRRVSNEYHNFISKHSAYIVTSVIFYSTLDSNSVQISQQVFYIQ